VIDERLFRGRLQSRWAAPPWGHEYRRGLVNRFPMPTERLSMRKMREVLRLNNAVGLSYREISEAYTIRAAHADTRDGHMPFTAPAAQRYCGPLPLTASSPRALLRRSDRRKNVPTLRFEAAGVSEAKSRPTERYRRRRARGNSPLRIWAGRTSVPTAHDLNWKLVELRVALLTSVKVTESVASTVMTVSNPTCVAAPITAI
jgi:hypothetical protein